MKLKIKTVTNERLGSTSEYLLSQMSQILPAYNEPGPFGEPPLTVNWEVIGSNVKAMAAEATEKFRKGMMRSSSYIVEVTARRVNVWKKTDLYEPEFLFTIYQEEETTEKNCSTPLRDLIQAVGKLSSHLDNSTTKPDTP